MKQIIKFVHDQQVGWSRMILKIGLLTGIGENFTKSRLVKEGQEKERRVVFDDCQCPSGLSL